MSVERVETLIAGGGQAGIAMSHQLSRRGCGHLVVERHRIARTLADGTVGRITVPVPELERTLSRFPASLIPTPDEFATAAEIVDFINAYVDAVAAPRPLRRRRDREASGSADDAAGFLAETSEGLIEAANRGRRHRTLPASRNPAAIAAAERGIFQVHASGYRNLRDQLPDGAQCWLSAGGPPVRRSPKN